MVVNNQINSNYALTPGDSQLDATPQPGTLSQPKAKEVKALFENAGLIVMMGDPQKTLLQVLGEVKEKKLDLSQLELTNALAALASTVDAKQKAAIEILKLATKTVENTIKNMTRTREEINELTRKRDQAKTEKEKADIQKQIDAKETELKGLNTKLTEAKASVSQAVSALGGAASTVLRGAMRTLAVSAFIRAAQEKTLENKNVINHIDASKQILEIFTDVEEGEHLNLGLKDVAQEIESVAKEFDYQRMKNDLSI